MSSDRQPDRPLTGVSILVPFDDPEQSLELKLAERGASVTFAPILQVVPAQSGWQSRLEECSTIVFFSKTAVRIFFDGLKTNEIGLPQAAGKADLAAATLPVRLRSLTWIAMGPGTKKELAKHGITESKVPPQSDSQGLAQFLNSQPFPEPLLLLRAAQGSSIVPDSLTDAGVDFQQLALYSAKEQQLDAKTKAMVADGRLHWITLASSSLATYAAKQLGSDLSRLKIASISPTTSARIRELGFEVSAEAEQFDYDGLVDTISAHVNRSN